MGQGTDPEVRRRADEAAGVLDDALREGIVVRGAREYTIRTIADTFMRGVRDKYDAAARLPAADRLKVQDELRAMDSNRAYDPRELLLSDVMKPQFPKAEQTICADLLAKAPVLVEIVRKELEKCREIANYIEDLG